MGAQAVSRRSLARRTSPRHTHELAKFVGKIGFDDLPPEAIRAAKNCLTDFMGTALSGSSSEWGKEVRNFVVAIGGRPEASLIGCRDRVSCSHAAYGNAIFAKVDDFDEGHRQLGGYHLGPTVIPAALAACQWQGKSGRDLITAVVVGYEIGIRLGAAMDVSAKLHVTPRINPNASCGVMAVVASVSKLLGLEADRVSVAWNIAACEMPLTMRKPNQISSLRTVIMGSTARAGVLAALMAKSLSLMGTGLTFEGKDGYCAQLSGTCRAEKLTEGLGGEYAIVRSYVKPYPCCRWIHPAVTALLELLAKNPLKADEIEKVTVRIGAEGFSLNRVLLLSEPAPFHEVQTSAKFSIPYAIASTLTSGKLTVEHYANSGLANERVRALMEKVKVIHEPRYDVMPLKMPALVRVQTRDGGVYSSAVDYPKGEPETPLSGEEFREKFRGLASGVLAADKVEAVERAIDQLEGLADIREVLACR